MITPGAIYIVPKMTAPLSSGKVERIPANEIQIMGSRDGKYSWLPWWAGNVTEMEISDSIVITGPFSGCWVVVYMNIDPISRFYKHVYISHIGTYDDKESVQTKEAKGAWNSFRQSAATKIEVLAAWQPGLNKKTVEKHGKGGSVWVDVHAAVERKLSGGVNVFNLAVNPPKAWPGQVKVLEAVPAALSQLPNPLT